MLKLIRHKRNADFRRFFAFALVLAMAMRVLAGPAAAANAPEGYVALCSGGQIIYVALDGSGHTTPEDRADPCPAAGFKMPLGLNETVETLSHPPEFAGFRLRDRWTNRDAQRSTGNRPRAPPA